MTTKTVRVLCLLLCAVMLFCMLPISVFAAPTETKGLMEYTVTIIGGTATFRDKTDTFSGTANIDDVLQITYSEQEGRTFDHWGTPYGTTISDKSFAHLVTDDVIFFAVYTDSYNYAFGEWELVEEGNCVEGSLYKRENEAGDVEYSIIYPNNGYHRHGDAVMVDDTYHKSVCSVCGHVEFGEHYFNDGEITQEPTHGACGIKTYTCYSCGATKTEKIEKTTEHVFGEWQIVEPSVNGQYGKRMRSCLHCDHTETYWYLDSNLESLLQDSYISYMTSSYGRTSHNERYYSYLNEDGNRVYIFATQYNYVLTNLNDSGRTFIYMFIDDGDSTTLKPIYLTKPVDDYMPKFEWAKISYAYTVEDWFKLLERPDLVTGCEEAELISTTMDARASGLMHGYDLWEEEYNNMMIPVTEDPDSFLTTTQEYGKWEFIGNGNMLSETYYPLAVDSYQVGGRETMQYRKSVSEAGSSRKYQYMTIDKATGVTLYSENEPSEYETYFASRKTITDSYSYAVMLDEEKPLYLDIETIEAELKAFCENRYAINLSLTVPEEFTAFRVMCEGATLSGDYTNAIIGNPARVFYASTEEAVKPITLTCKEHDGYIFEGWEMYNFATGEWIPVVPTLDSDKVAIINTEEMPLTDVTYIRCKERKIPELMCNVKVNGGSFTIDGDDSYTYYTEAEVPCGTTISLSDNYIEHKRLDRWEDKDGNTVEKSWDIVIVDDAEYTAVLVDEVYSMRALAYNGNGSVWQIGYEEDAGDYAEASGIFGTEVTFSTSGEGEYDEFLGWYNILYGKEGMEVTLLSKMLNYTHTIDGYYQGDLVAVWSDGTVSVEPEPIVVRVINGFINISLDNSSTKAVAEKVLYVSAADFYGEESVKIIDDYTLFTKVDSWRVVWTSSDGVQINDYDTDTACFNLQLESADTYVDNVVTVIAIMVPPCVTHTWDDGVVTKAPTHTEFGEMTYTCTVCGATKTEPIAKLTEHTFGEWTRLDDEKHQRTCSCGETETANHEWDDGAPSPVGSDIVYTCTVCGATKTEAAPVIITITYYPNGGTGTMKPTTGEAPRVASNAFNNIGNYMFTGWNTKADGTGTDYAIGTVATADVELYAQWTPCAAAPFTLIYNANGGFGAMASKLALTHVAAANAFVYTHHTFTGWNTAPDGSGTAYAVGDVIAEYYNPVTLYAQWEDAVYTIDYYANNGTDQAMPQSVATGAPVTFAECTFTAPVGSDGVFLYWNTKADGTGTTYYPGKEIAASRTVFAIWGIPSYTITYKANNGEGMMENGANTVDACGFARTGFSFLRWDTKANGTGTAYLPGDTVSSNVTLYAIWTPNTYTITYDANGGTDAPEAKTFTYAENGVVVLTGKVPVRDGFVFAYWCTDSTGLGDVYRHNGTYDMSNFSCTLYAIWDAEAQPVYDKTAYIGETGFDTLAAAFAAARNMGTDNVDIHLRQDTSVTTRQYVYAEQNVTLYLHGNIYRTTNAIAFYIRSGANLTVMSDDAGAIITSGSYGISVCTGGSFMMERGLIEANSYPVYNKGYVTMLGSVTLNCVSASGIALYNYAQVDSIIDCTLKGKYAVYNYANETYHGNIHGIDRSTLIGSVYGIVNKANANIETITDSTITASAGTAINNSGVIRKIIGGSISGTTYAIQNGSTGYIGELRQLSITTSSTSTYALYNLGAIQNIVFADITGYSGIRCASNSSIENLYANITTNGGIGIYLMEKASLGYIGEVIVKGKCSYGFYNKSDLLNTQIINIVVEDAVSYGIYNKAGTMIIVKGDITSETYGVYNAGTLALQSDNVHRSRITAGKYGISNAGTMDAICQWDVTAPRAITLAKSTTTETVGIITSIQDCVITGVNYGISVANGSKITQIGLCNISADTTTGYAIMCAGEIQALANTPLSGRYGVYNTGVIGAIEGGNINATTCALYNRGTINIIVISDTPTTFAATGAKATAILNYGYISRIIGITVQGYNGIVNSRTGLLSGFIISIENVKFNVSYAAINVYGGTLVVSINNANIESACVYGISNSGIIGFISGLNVANAKYGVANSGIMQSSITNSVINATSYGIYNRGNMSGAAESATITSGVYGIYSIGGYLDLTVADITAKYGIYNGSNGIIGEISGSIVATATGISNSGSINEISADISGIAATYGVYNNTTGTIQELNATITVKTYAVYNKGTIIIIAGGTYSANSYGCMNTGTITYIAGGIFTGVYGLYNKGTISYLYGGKYKGSKAARAIYNTGNIFYKDRISGKECVLATTPDEEGYYVVKEK